MSRAQWQIDQGNACGCRGSDDYCPCQNTDRSTMTKPQGEGPAPVAWARRWYIDGETPAKERNANGRMAWPKKFTYHEVTKAKCFADDVALYAAPAPDLAALERLASKEWMGNPSDIGGELIARILFAQAALSALIPKGG